MRVEYQQQGQAGEDRAKALAADIWRYVPSGEAASPPESQRDRRIDVGAADVPGGIDNGRHYGAKDKTDSPVSKGTVTDLVRDDGSTSSKHQDVSAHRLGDAAFD